MASKPLIAQLRVLLKDDASGQAKALASTLKGLEKSAVDFAKSMNGAKWGSSFTRQLGGLKATGAELEQIKKSWSTLQQSLSGTGVRNKMRLDAQRQWSNEWLSRLQAVRVAAQQNSDEAVRNAKRVAVEEKRAAAETARERVRIAKEEVRQKQREARNAEQADRRAARERASAARRELQEQTRLSRAAARESARAERDARRDERRNGRGAGAIGRAVVRNAGYALGVGGGTYMAGRAVRATARQGGEALREDARDYLAGLTPEQTKQLSGMATKNSAAYKSLTTTSLHNVYRESAMTALNMGGTEALSGDLAQGLVVLQSLKGREQAMSQLTGFMRGLDTLGKNVDPAEVRALLDGMARAAGVQGVEYNPRDIFMLAKRAKSAGGPLSTEFLNTIAPSLIADMGPENVGTALGTSLSAIVAGTKSGGMSKAKLALMTKWGLRDKATGKMSPEDRKLILSDPHRFAWERLMPALVQQGVNIDDDGAVSEAINQIMPQKPADMFSKLIQQRQQYQATQGKLAKAPGLKGATELDSRDPFVALEGVTSQMKNTAAEFSRPIIETILPGLHRLSGGLNKLAATIRENPEFAKSFGANAANTAGGGLFGAAALALSALWQGKGIAGAISGGLKGGAAGAITGGLFGYLFPKAYELTPGISDILKGVGRTASGANYTAKDAGALFDLAAQLNAVQGRITGIKDRTHPSRAGEPNAELTQLEGEAQDLRNRISSSTAGIGNDLVTNLANGIIAGTTTVTTAMDMVMEQLRTKAREGVTIPLSVSSGGFATGDPAAPARASGGSVAAGGLYQVNEFGKELFIPSESGTIVDPRRLKPGSGGSRGSNSIQMGNISISVPGAGDPAAVAREVVQVIEREIQSMAQAAFADLGVELA